MKIQSINSRLCPKVNANFGVLKIDGAVVPNTDTGKTNACSKIRGLTKEQAEIMINASEEYIYSTKLKCLKGSDPTGKGYFCTTLNNIPLAIASSKIATIIEKTIQN